MLPDNGLAVHVQWEKGAGQTSGMPSYGETQRRVNLITEASICTDMWNSLG